MIKSSTALHRIRVNFNTTCEKVLRSIGPYNLGDGVEFSLDEARHGRKMSRIRIAVRIIKMTGDRGFRGLLAAQTEDRCAVASTLECLFYIRKHPKILNRAYVLGHGPGRRDASGLYRTFYHYIGRKDNKITVVEVENEGDVPDDKQLIFLGHPWNH